MTACPTSRTGSPTPAPKASTPASRRSRSLPAATATVSTPRPPSTSTSADYSLSYFAHRITNAGAEGLNSRIQAIKVSARGYRNREHSKTAIYFHLGGLQPVLLRAPDHQRRRRRPQLPHPGDQGLCPRLPQP